MMKSSHSRHPLSRAAHWGVTLAVSVLALLPPADLSPCRTITAAASAAAQPIHVTRPKDVVADRMGNLYIADTGNGRILFCSQSGGSRVILDRLRDPSALALDDLRNVLYVAETRNNRILCITLSNNTVMICVTGILNQPNGLAVDGLGNLYIADTGNDRILYRAQSGAICTVRTDPYELNRPKGVATALGELFIADTGNNRILRRAGGCSASPVSIIETFPLNQPADLAISPFGLFVADTCNNRVLQIDIGATSTVLAGVGPEGCGNGSYCGDRGPGNQSCLNAPEGVTAYLDQIFIADTDNHRLRQVGLDGGMIDSVECK